MVREKQIPKGWLKSHMNQSKKFIKKYKKTPTKFIKDRANINILQ